MHFLGISINIYFEIIADYLRCGLIDCLTFCLSNIFIIHSEFLALSHTALIVVFINSVKWHTNIVWWFLCTFPINYSVSRFYISRQKMGFCFVLNESKSTWPLNGHFLYVFALGSAVWWPLIITMTTHNEIHKHNLSRQQQCAAFMLQDRRKSERAIVNGECGQLFCIITEHTWMHNNKLTRWPPTVCTYHYVSMLQVRYFRFYFAEFTLWNWEAHSYLFRIRNYAAIRCFGDRWHLTSLIQTNICTHWFSDFHTDLDTLDATIGLCIKLSA